jgi:hypothetical protein
MNFPQASRTLLPLLLLAGCHSSPYIQVAIRNQGSAPVNLIEVDYPSASFGVDQIAPHARFHYRFKVQGSGPLTITFTGAGHKVYTATGPSLQDGQRGSLGITVTPAGQVEWSTEIQPPQQN